MAPVIEHNGTTPVWWLVPPQEIREATEGGFLELVSEWEVAGGGAVDAHSHPTHEFYYILSGHGIMKIADEEREVQKRRPRVHPTGHHPQHLAGQPARPAAGPGLRHRYPRGRHGRLQLSGSRAVRIHFDGFVHREGMPGPTGHQHVHRSTDGTAQGHDEQGAHEWDGPFGRVLRPLHGGQAPVDFAQHELRRTNVVPSSTEPQPRVTHARVPSFLTVAAGARVTPAACPP